MKEKIKVALSEEEEETTAAITELCKSPPPPFNDPSDAGEEDSESPSSSLPPSLGAFQKTTPPAQGKGRGILLTFERDV